MTTDLEKTRADLAFETEGKIKEGISAARTVWVALAAFLSDFHEEKMWETLGHDSFDSWLATPEIDLGRSMAYALVQNYRYFIGEGRISSEELAEFEPTKLQQVLPALKAGDVEPSEALADVGSLSRSDLKEKYGKPGKSAAGKSMEKCGICGQQREAEAA